MQNDCRTCIFVSSADKIMPKGSSGGGGGAAKGGGGAAKGGGGAARGGGGAAKGGAGGGSSAGKKTPMTSSDASRIQAAEARAGGTGGVKSGGFASRAQVSFVISSRMLCTRRDKSTIF